MAAAAHEDGPAGVGEHGAQVSARDRAALRHRAPTADPVEAGWAPVEAFISQTHQPRRRGVLLALMLGTARPRPPRPLTPVPLQETW